MTYETDDKPSDQIAGYDVKGTIEHLGPIVWTDAHLGPDGVRVTDFERVDAKALPPELTTSESNVLTLGILGKVLEEYVLPELRQRSGASISLGDVLSSPSPELLREALVLISPEGKHSVYLNAEVCDQSVPEGYGFARLARDGFKWSIHMDFKQLFPPSVKSNIEASARELVAAILKGDEAGARDLVRLSFPAMWKDNPDSLRAQMHKEVYVLLFGLFRSARSNPLANIGTELPNAVAALRSDYSIEGIKAEARERDGSGGRIEEFLSEMDNLFSRAKLSSLELSVVHLELELAYYDERLAEERWSQGDREKFLGIQPGTFANALHRARKKFQDASRVDSGPYRKLLEAVLKGSGAKAPWEQC